MEITATYTRFTPSKEIIDGLGLRGTYFTNKSSPKYAPFKTTEEETATWEKYIKYRNAKRKNKEKISFYENYLFEKYYVFMVYISVYSPGKQLMDQVDAVQEAADGLITAIRKYDLNRKTDDGMPISFTTMAIRWIKQRVQRASVDSNNTIPLRLPHHIVSKMLRVNKFSDDELKTMSDDTFQRYVGITRKQYENYKSFSIYISTDTPIGDEEELTIGSILRSDLHGSYTENEVEYSAEKNALNDLINKHAAALPPRVGDMLLMKYGINGYPVHTLDEIGEKYAITRERVRQLLVKGLRKLNKDAEVRRVGTAYGLRLDIEPKYLR